MKSIARHLASAMVSLASLHPASGLPLDPRQVEPAPAPPFPITHRIAGETPLTALLQPLFEAPAILGTGMSPSSVVPHRDIQIRSSFLEFKTTGDSLSATGRAHREVTESFALPPSLAEFSLPPDVDLRALPHNAHLDDSALNSYRAVLGSTRMPITIPEPQSASLLAIGLAGLGLRACWGARRRMR